MAIRTSMVDLIGKLRLLINDPSGTDQVFEDQTIQNYLDRHQTVVSYAELLPVKTITSGGTVTYLDYYSEAGDWESDETLYDGNYQQLTPTTSDRLTGHWTFSSSQLPPVRIVGKVYDIYGAAADLLEVWAAREKLSFDFATDNQSFKRSQKISGLLALAQEYRRQQRPVSVKMVRGDVN